MWPIKLNNRWPLFYALISAFVAGKTFGRDIQQGVRSDRLTRQNSFKKIQPPEEKLHQKLTQLRQTYRMGRLPKKIVWEKLDALINENTNMRSLDRLMAVNMQASLLLDAGYPILAAIYSSQALRLVDSPWNVDSQAAWNVLKQSSSMRPIQTVLEVVASETNFQGRTTPVFGSDWNYFVGNALAHKSENLKAIEAYRSVKYGDKHYFSAKYQEAMLLVELDKLSEAEGVLKKIIAPSVQGLDLPHEESRLKINDFAYLALGRIYYEDQRFSDSIKMYRKVSKTGRSFYDALFEQAWASFLAGYPMHALGALHGAESPFYANVFNPEATLLRSMIHYWLCRYDDSRNALADFMEKYQSSVQQLKNYLDRKNLEPEVAYQLFENLVTGVSSDSLGLPKPVLETAAEKDSMLLIRDQYAAVIEEKTRLSNFGVFGSKLGKSRAQEIFDKWLSALQKDIGRKFLAELRDMKKDFERLFAQAEFLYVELLMSEKDQILGKELHASTKITRVRSQLKIRGWGGETQTWADPKNGEYWWDEVGFYIAPVESMCIGNQVK